MCTLLGTTCKRSCVHTTHDLSPPPNNSHRLSKSPSTVHTSTCDTQQPEPEGRRRRVYHAPRRTRPSLPSLPLPSRTRTLAQPAHAPLSSRQAFPAVAPAGATTVAAAAGPDAAATSFSCGETEPRERRAAAWCSLSVLDDHRRVIASSALQRRRRSPFMNHHIDITPMIPV